MASQDVTPARRHRLNEAIAPKHFQRPPGSSARNLEALLKVRLCDPAAAGQFPGADLGPEDLRYLEIGRHAASRIYHKINARRGDP